MTLGTEAAATAGKTVADRAETAPTEDVGVSQVIESATRRPFALCWDERTKIKNRHSNGYLLQ